jgi:hypothetical protein
VAKASSQAASHRLPSVGNPIILPHMTQDPTRLTLYGSFTSSSSYKPMLYLALARLPFSFRTVNLKNGVQKQPE